MNFIYNLFTKFVKLQKGGDMKGINNIKKTVFIIMWIEMAFSQQINLSGFKFDPLKDKIGEKAAVSGIKDWANNKVFLIQFKGPISREDYLLLSSKAIIFGYIPNFSYLVNFPDTSAMKFYLKKFKDPKSNIRWIGHYLPEFKISPSIGKINHEPDSPYRDALEKGLRPFLVQVFPNAQLEKVISLLKKVGEIKDISKGLFYNRIEIYASSDVLSSIAKIPEVWYIWEKADYKLFNYRHREVVQSGAARDTTIFYGKGITGEGEIIAIMDSGLDNTSCFFTRSGKIFSYRAFGRGDLNNCTHPNFSHGTHVCGTAAGWLNGTNHKWDGVAYKAQIAFQDIKPNWSCGNSYVYPPNDLTNAFNTAYSDGARVHSNSWGGGSGYGPYSEDADAFTYANPDFLILFANGNNGSVPTEQANAKNIIAVGATGMPNTPYFNNKASYSNPGPAEDGRYKPDLVNVAGEGVSGNDTTWTWSAYSYESASSNCYIAGSVGTSMATPGLAGAVILLRQYFTGGFHPDYPAITPSAALLKATLIAGSDILASNVVDNDVGWGRVNLDKAAEFAGDMLDLEFVDGDAISGTGVSLNYNLSVLSNTSPLKIVLVWTDPAASPGANPALVNDLDLIVQSPSGTSYRGNNFSGGESKPGGNPDNINNVEVVYIQSPQSGNWKITVYGSNLPQPPQFFALAITGDLGGLMGIEESQTLFVSSTLSGVVIKWIILPTDEKWILKKSLEEEGDYKTIAMFTRRDLNEESISYVDTDVEVEKTYFYKLIVVGLNETKILGPVSITYSPGMREIVLHSPVPNPTKDKVKFSFVLPIKEQVSLSIFDVTGKKIKEIVNKILSPGKYTYFWNLTNIQGNRVSAGIYFAVLNTKRVKYREKILVLK